MASVAVSNGSLALDEQYKTELRQLFKDLKTVAVTNLEYFQNVKGANNERFFTCFSTLWDHIESGIEPVTFQLLATASNFDCSELIRANGYRSVVKVIHKCCLHLMQLSRHILVTKETMLFRATFYSNELEAFVTLLGQLRACAFYAQKLLVYCNKGRLFPDVNSLPEADYRQASLLLSEVEALCQEPFYGRCLGFHYCSSMKMPLTTISLAMASYGDGYLHDSAMMKFASSMYSGSKYIMDPESRAKQFVRMSRSDDVKFCKAFWSLAENTIAHSLPLLVCPPVQVDLTIDIQPDVIELPSAKGDGVVPINPPCAHFGPAPVCARLISHSLREGQGSWLQRDGKTVKNAALPLSPGLIIHVHGGGFVSQSSASHEIYLRQWAKDTGAPVLSIDYSLAPEAPFPRQMEEVFFAYCWALKNAHLLGSTAEHVALVGDSAGGNLSTATVMRCAQFGIRQPDGLLTVYGCFMVQYTPSPSRILSLMDPLLPLGIMAQVLSAYSGINVNLLSPDNLIELNSGGVVETAATASDAQAAAADGAQAASADGSQAAATDGAQAAAPTEYATSEPSDKVEVLVDVQPGADNEDDDSTAAAASLAGFKKKTPLSHIQRHRPSASRDSGYDGYLDDNGGSDDTNSSSSNKSLSTAVPSITFKSATDVSTEQHKSSEELSTSLKSRKSSLVKSDDNHNSSLVSQDSRRKSSLIKSDSGRQRKESQPNALTDEYEVITTAEEPRQRSASTSTKTRNDLISKLRLDLSNLWGKIGPRRASSNVSMPTTPGTKTPHSGGISDEPSPYWSCQSTPFSSSPDQGFMSPTYAKMRHFAQSPVDFFKHLPVLNNPYMSPLLAPDGMLDCLCPVYLVACHLDPLLDDSIMFAKRLMQLKREVHVDIIDDLSHGFLNFVLVCPEARRASDLCVKRLRQILCVEMEDNYGSDDEMFLTPVDTVAGWEEFNANGNSNGIDVGEECVEDWQLGAPQQ